MTSIIPEDSIDGTQNFEAGSQLVTPFVTKRSPSSTPGNKNAKRRLGQNLSEQRRATRIRQEIGKMEHILRRANRLAKSDRYSILAAAVNYIEELEEQLTSVPDSRSSTGTPIQPYSTVFKYHGLPQMIVSLDGTIVDCNRMFLWLTGEEDVSGNVRNFFPGVSFSKIHEMIRLSKQLNSGMCSSSCRQKCLCKSGASDVFLSASVVILSLKEPAHLVLTILPLIYTNVEKSIVYVADNSGRINCVEQDVVAKATDCSLHFGTCNCADGLSDVWNLGITSNSSFWYTPGVDDSARGEDAYSQREAPDTELLFPDPTFTRPQPCD